MGDCKVDIPCFSQSNAVFDRTSSSIALDKSCAQVSQVSPARKKYLEAMGIHTLRDLLNNFPHRYLDLTHMSTIARAKIGNTYTICGNIHEVQLKQPRPKLSLTEICIVDGTSTLMVTMFHMPWLSKQLQVGQRIAVAGKVEFNYGFKRMTNPLFEIIDESDPDTGKIVPIHPSCEKISPVNMRRLIHNALIMGVSLPDPIPLDIRIKRKLMSRARAYQCVHFPSTLQEAASARKRIAYEELFFLQLCLQQEDIKRSHNKKAYQHTIAGKHQQALLDSLPFSLTQDQSIACNEINEHLASDSCSNHLLLGDVGCGKTVVAAFAIAACADSGTQSFFMAPTEVLAQQHASALSDLFDACGITWELLVGSTTKKERDRIIQSAAKGNIDVLIGTHALLEDDVVVPKCSLVVIDEQQRFGVDQRKKLLSKGSAPDALYLTATPIPRTLALATFGNMSFSYLREKPHSSKRVTTLLQRNNKGHAYDAALHACKQGDQVYVICPLIGKDSTRGDSSKSKSQGEEYVYSSISIENDQDYTDDSTKSYTSAIQHAEYLQKKIFVDYSLALLHGRMSAEEKRSTMDSFREGKIQVLVSTTVIETGIDVANATVMIIEDADKFGLSQLHQLRGRVGRGEKNAQVFLISNSTNEDANKRLMAMEECDDGLQLASFDLSLRREGDILGNRQHGVSSLKLVNISRDSALIEAAHADAEAVLKNDPELTSTQNLMLGREVRMLFRDDTSHSTVGIGG